MAVAGRLFDRIPLEEQASIVERYLKSHPETGLSVSDMPNWIPRIHNFCDNDKIIVGLNIYLPDNDRGSGYIRTLEAILGIIVDNIPEGMTFVNGIDLKNVILNDEYVNYEPGVFWTVIFMDPESDEKINSIVNRKPDPPVRVPPKNVLLALISNNFKKGGSSEPLALEAQNDSMIYESVTSEVLMNVLWDFGLINPGNINRQTPSPVFKGYKLKGAGMLRDYLCAYLNKNNELTLDRYYTSNNQYCSYPKIMKIRCCSEIGFLAQFINSA